MAREVISDFLFKLGFDGKDVQKGFNKFEDGLKNLQTNVKAAATSMKKDMKGIFEDVGVPIKPRTGGTRGDTSTINEGMRGRDLDAVDKQFKKIQKTRAEVKNLTDAQRASMAQLLVRARSLGRGIRNATNPDELKDFRQQLRLLNGDFNTLDREVRKATRSTNAFAQAGRRAKSSFIGLGSSVIGAVAAVEAFQGIVQNTIAFESLERGFNDVFKAAGEAEAELAFVKETSAELGLNFKEAGKDYLKLAAALQDTQPELTQDLFVELTKRMKVFGNTSAQIQLGMKAMTQIASKGRVSLEELKGQLGDQLPAALSISAKAMGLTQAELFKLIESGKLASTEFLPKFTAELKKMNASLGPDAFDTLESAVTNAMSSLQQMGATIGASGFGEGLTFLLKMFSFLVEQLDPLLALIGGIAKGLFFFFGAIVAVIGAINWFISLFLGNDGMLWILEQFGMLIGIFLGAMLLRFIFLTTVAAGRVALLGLSFIASAKNALLFATSLKAVGNAILWMAKRFVPIIAVLSVLWLIGQGIAKLFGVDIPNATKKFDKSITATIDSDEGLSRFRQFSDSQTTVLPNQTGTRIDTGTKNVNSNNDNRIMMTVEGGITPDVMDDALSRQAQITGDDA